MLTGDSANAVRVIALAAEHLSLRGLTSESGCARSPMTTRRTSRGSTLHVLHAQRRRGRMVAHDTGILRSQNGARPSSARTGLGVSYGFSFLR